MQTDTPGPSTGHRERYPCTNEPILTPVSVTQSSSLCQDCFFEFHIEERVTPTYVGRSEWSGCPFRGLTRGEPCPRYVPRHQLQNDLAEFLGTSVEQVLARRKDIVDSKLQEAAWRAKARDTEQDILDYYENEDCYLYMYSAGLGTRSELLAPLIRFTGGRGKVLDYGCGVAAEAYWLARSGAYQVSLADLDSPHFRFAQWRFRRYGLPEGFYVLPKDRVRLFRGRFDAIICLEVIEHVTHWRQMLDDFVSSLEPGGWLLMTVGKPTPDNTLHINRLTGLTEEAYRDHLTRCGMELAHTDSPQAEFWVWRKPP